MLRELGTAERRAQDGSPQGSAAATLVRRDRPRLLLLHQGDLRIAALEHVLGDLGYRGCIAAAADEALAAIARGPVPDVLVTGCAPLGAPQSLAFPRECLARWPALRALYLSFIPVGLPGVSPERERVLAAPFNAAELAAALAELWPGPEGVP